MIFSCLNLAVPIDIMQHVVQVESSGNPYPATRMPLALLVLAFSDNQRI